MAEDARDPTPGDHFHVPGDTADVRAVQAVVMTLVGEGSDAPRWLVRTTGGELWVLMRDSGLPGVAFRGHQSIPGR